MTIRARPAPDAEKLWSALRKAGKRGLTAVDAASTLGISVPYARKTLRVWAAAGHADVEQPATMARDASSVYRMVKGAPPSPPIVTANGEVHPREGHMSGEEFAAARRLLGLSLVEMGRALGRTAIQPTVSREMRRFETGRPISMEMAEDVRRLLAGYRGPKPAKTTREQT